MMRQIMIMLLLGSLGLIYPLFSSPVSAAERPSILHISYDATRELLHEYNKAFAKRAVASGEKKPRVRMSHGSSGKQARAVLDGLRADVVSLALAYDLNAIEQAGHLPKNWQSALPNQSSPFYSTIVLLVRKGNPKNITGWKDLARSDVSVLTPNPKTSGGARWGYLAAWAYAQEAFAQEAARKKFMCSWIQNVPFWDTAARAATTSFIRRKKGDVLISWENEAYVARKYFGEDAFEVIVPNITIKAEPKLAVLPREGRSDAKTALLDQYVKGLYTPDAQAMITTHFFRPVHSKHDTILPKLKSVKLKNIAALGGFEKMHAAHFAENALFDQCTIAKHASLSSVGQP